MSFKAEQSAINLRSNQRIVKDQSGAEKLKIGEFLSKAGYITTAQFDEAKTRQRRSGKRLGQILLEIGAIEHTTIANFLSRMHNYTQIFLAREVPSKEALALVPYEVAKRHLSFPLRVVGDTLHLTMAEPTDTLELEQLRESTRKSLVVGVSTIREIVDAYRKYYHINEAEYQSFFVVDAEREEDAITQIDDFGALVSNAVEDFEIDSGTANSEAYEQFSASDTPIIKLVNGILIKAVQEGASDIHIEPFERTMQVRYRKDGSLFKSMNLPLAIKNAMAARMKILAGLNITERRVPQDGRIKIRLGRTKAVDFRVSTLPLLHGEGIVLRVLDKSSLNADLTKLGFSEKAFAILTRCLKRPQGLLLVTGPTGSGKTVTLYSALNSLNTEDIKILTAEEPVEFNFKGVNQVNVNAEVGMTFAAALKAFLRQDPDIIMVGEIRDLETAEIAMKAAMTGHLVFATLHTNDSPATVSRMIDIGIPSYILASSLTMVLSQRLGRLLCPHCKVPAQYERQELLAAGFLEHELPALKLFKARGCPECNGLGYKGRVGFFEIMEITDRVAEAIQANVSEEHLRKIAVREGMQPLRTSGLEKVREGLTSLEEVLKRTVVHENSLPAYLVTSDIEVYEDRDVIIQEGNKDKDFFKLVRGKVVVVRAGKKIAEITEPGEYFGEMATMLDEPRCASIISVGRSEIKRYPGDKMDEIIEKYPFIAKVLFRSITGRLNRTNRIVVQLASATKARPAQVVRQ